MTTIRIDDQEYDSETFSEDAKEQLKMLQYVEGELVRLQANAAMLQTARNAYLRALKQALPARATAAFEGDTLKLG